MAGQSHFLLVQSMKVRIVKYQLKPERKKMFVVSKRKKNTFTCEMCKNHHLGSFSYIYETYSVSPNNLSKELVICEKCAVRESGKDVKQLPLV